MTEQRQVKSGVPWTNRTSPKEAFDRATSELRIEGIDIDAEAVPELVAYRDGFMTIVQAVEALRRRHSSVRSPVRE